ncbi:hypothetical protein CFP65_0633 [Kitasatospora sp. MMS16-BH015]|uniref:hypothetical protein n=1 Tax=Kitasatospora sp. MMS16-BH015 TaxID=2018025 RepID=UPI000CA0D9B8|nr:hypothetical protein [Kitasatospora sp. MMS16-BH015]AUG75589.1 hypothetical protein CFP65_0633 [Kitasatospora sp. MMS16-BH015]
MTDDQPTRVLRAAVFTALAVPLSALGHVVITGRALPLSLVAAATAVVLVLAYLAAGPQRRFLHITAVLVPVELLLNTAFNLGQDTCASAAPGHGVDLLVCGGGSVDGSVLGSVTPGTAQLLVLAVHLVLALAAALWLRLGEAALTGLAEALRALAEPFRALLLLLAPLPCCPAALAPAVDAAPALPHPGQVLLGPAPRRGPPALALAA